MKKSIFLFFAAILCAFSMNVQAADLKGGEVVLLKPGTNWKKDGARFAVYFFNNSTNKNQWVSMKAVEGETDLYYAIAPTGTWKNLIYARMNPGNNTNDWGSKWNQSADLTWTNTKSLFTVSNSSWDGATTTWSAKKVASTGKLTASSVNVSENEAVTLTPSLTSNTAINTIQSTTYTISPSTGASVSGNTFTATAAGKYTVKATIKYRLNGYTTTTFESTVDAEATITVASAADPKHDVKVTWTDGTTELQPSQTISVGESTGYPVEAPEFKDYTFSGWTLGSGVQSADENANPISITTKTSGIYTLTANYSELPKETVYFINTPKWTGTINAYAWTDGTPKVENAGWAGLPAKKEDFQIGEYEVYSYTATQGKYANVIFNGTGGQTADLTWAEGVDKYYIHNYNGNTGWYTQAEAEEILVAPVVEETVYFVNNKNWTKVQVHAWKDAANNGWPGQALTATGEKVAGFDVYSFTAPQGTYTNLLFNNKEGDAGVQSNNFVWTADKYYYMDAAADYAGGTAAEVEAALAAPVVEETVYFVNNKNWTKVQVHAWKDAANNGWPGQALTATGEKVAGFDVYSFTAAQGTYTNLLFNNKEGDAGVQSNNFVWTDGKYYYMGAAENYAGGTKEEVAVLVTPDPLATEVYLAGDMTNKDNWDVNKKEFRKATADATNASVTVTLEAQTYKFKLVVDGAWKGNTGTMQRGGVAVHEGGWSFDKDGYDDNCQIVADIAGDYTFTWNLTDKKLTVAYPPLPKHQVNVTVNPAESGTVTGTGEYEQGSEATLIAAPAAGYTFKNWTVGGTEKSVEATYKFTVTEAVELVANFVPEVTNEVTVSYLCNGTPIPGQAETKLAVGVTTPSTISAPAITNYKFDSWTLGTGVQSEDESKNPIKVTSKSTGDYTLTANYIKIELTYTVEVPAGTEKCYIRGGFDGWDKFHEMELKDGETNVFTLTIDGAVTTDEYKYACQESWEYQEQKEDGGYVNNRTWTALDRVEKWGKPVIVTYQLKGVGGWEQPGIELVQNPGNDKEYMLTCQAISATDAIKVVRLEDGVIKDYYGNGTVKDGVAVTVNYDGDGNITLPEGKYNFYFDTNEPEKKLWIEAATDCQTVTEITLTEGDNGSALATEGDVTVTVERVFEKEHLYTIALPFTINNAASVFGNGTVVYNFANLAYDKTNEEYILGFTTVSKIEAGKPYLIEPGKDVSSFVAENVTLSGATSISQKVKVDNVEKTATMTAVLSKTTTGGSYWLAENRYLYNGEVDMPALRALFVLPTTPSGMPARARVALKEDAATGVEDLFTTDAPVKVIVNGQLIIIRDGEMYNVQGQLVK